jgi:hypothetical protein
MYMGMNWMDQEEGFQIWAAGTSAILLIFRM